MLASPFAKAISKAEAMMVIPNLTSSIYTRLWCVLEAKLAIERELPIILAAPTPRFIDLYIEQLLSPRAPIAGGGGW